MAHCTVPTRFDEASAAQARRSLDYDDAQPAVERGSWIRQVTS